MMRLVSLKFVFIFMIWLYRDSFFNNDCLVLFYLGCIWYVWWVNECFVKLFEVKIDG